MWNFLYTYVKFLKKFCEIVFHVGTSLGVIHLSQNTWKWARNAEKGKEIARYFATLFSQLAPLFLQLAPLFSRFVPPFSCQGPHSQEKSKDFVVYFFPALIKHEKNKPRRKVYSDCFVFRGVLQKTFAKCKKWKKWIAGLIVTACSCVFLSLSVEATRQPPVPFFCNMA